MFILPNYREARVRIPLPVPPGNFSMFSPSKSNLEEILKLLGAAVQQFDRKKFYCCILCFLYCSFNEKPSVLWETPQF